MKPTMHFSSFSIDAGVESFVESLKTYDADEILTNATQEQIMSDIAELPAEHQRQAANAFIEALQVASAGLDQRIVELSKMMGRDKKAQDAAGPSIVRGLYPRTHANKRFPLSQAEKDEGNLNLIEKNWGKTSASRYRAMKSLSQSASQCISTMSSRVEEFVALSYLNAEILDRVEKKSYSTRGKKEGHHITNVDARVAKEKVVKALENVSGRTDALPLPVLDTKLLEKHGLRVSTTTGLLKPKTDRESDEETVDKNMVDKNLADKNMADKNMADKNMADKNMVNKNFFDMSMNAGENMVDNNTVDNNMVDNMVNKNIFNMNMNVGENIVNKNIFDMNTIVGENMVNKNMLDMNTIFDKNMLEENMIFDKNVVDKNIFGEYIFGENNADGNMVYEYEHQNENFDKSKTGHCCEVELMRTLGDYGHTQKLTGREAMETPEFWVRLEAWLLQDLEDGTLAGAVVNFLRPNLGWIMTSCS